jgi:hypothetical protein
MPKDETNISSAAKWSRRSLMAGSTALATAATTFWKRSPAVAQNSQLAGSAASRQAGGKPPNILVIFGDDIGISQISAYTMGLMGYRTPNIDRIASEGAICRAARRVAPRSS